MRCDAVAEIEGDAVEMIARARRTIAAAFLQACDVRVAKVPAARTLGEIAAQSGEVADLRGRQTRRGGGDAGIGILDPLVRSDRRDGCKRAEGGGAIGA